MPTWTKTTEDLTKNLKVRFVQFLDAVTAINGTDNPITFDGTDWTDTTIHDTANFPVAKYAIEWKDRIYCAGVSGNFCRLYYSTIAVAGGTITWGGDYIDIEPEAEQGNITGLAKVPGYLLVFKERALKRWDGSSTYPDDLEILGSPSQESIVNTGKTVMYFSAGYKDSVSFQETNGSETRKISRAIQEITEAIPSANYSDVAGFSDGNTVRWSIGSGIVLDGITYNNVEVLYHITTHTWQVFNYPTKHTIYSPYISGTDLKMTCGDDDGQVIELDTGTTDEYTT